MAGETVLSLELAGDNVLSLELAGDNVPSLELAEEEELREVGDGSVSTKS